MIINKNKGKAREQIRKLADKYIQPAIFNLNQT